MLGSALRAMAKLTTKSNVRLKSISPALAWILFALEGFARELAVVPEVVITSINDSRHGINSRHYTDEAVDVRSKNFPTVVEKLKFRAGLELALGPKFRVLFENPAGENEHFHIQVKKGHSYP